MDSDEFLGFRALPSSGQVVTNSMIDKIRSAAIDWLAGACRTTHHDFWPSDVSILDASLVDPNALL